MLSLNRGCRYFLCTQATDMRKGFDGLCGSVIRDMGLNALSGHIYIFINKKRNQIKLLLWEQDGLSIYHKRLEKGTYELPTNSTNSELTSEQLMLILHGISLKSIRKRKRFKSSLHPTENS